MSIETLQNLRYPASMDAATAEARKTLGEHVRATREVAYKSRPAFAEAANISERSIASVETGDSAGTKVLRAVEKVFHWPRDSMAAYIAGLGPLPETPQVEAPEQPADELTTEQLETFKLSADEREKILAMSFEETLDFARELAKTSKLASLLWLNMATELQVQAAQGTPASL